MRLSRIENRWRAAAGLAAAERMRFKHTSLLRRMRFKRSLPVMDHAGFSWDEAKSETCYAERGFDFAFAARLFDGPVLVRIDGRHDHGETRFQAIGRIEGLLYVVVYAPRGETTHIISARRAHQKEWERWLK
jgi:hypothetical protein